MLGHQESSVIKGASCNGINMVDFSVFDFPLDVGV